MNGRNGNMDTTTPLSFVICLTVSFTAAFYSLICVHIYHRVCGYKRHGSGNFDTSFVSVISDPAGWVDVWEYQTQGGRYIHA